MIDLKSARQLGGELLGAVLTRLAPAGTTEPCPRRPACPSWCPCRIDTDLDERRPRTCAPCTDGDHAECMVESPSFSCPCAHPAEVMA